MDYLPVLLLRLEGFFPAGERAPAKKDEHSLQSNLERKEFFASHPSELRYEYNFLDFDYHGQPLEEVLPLLNSICFDYRYVDDGVSLDGIEF